MLLVVLLFGGASTPLALAQQKTRTLPDRTSSSIRTHTAAVPTWMTRPSQFPPDRDLIEATYRAMVPRVAPGITARTAAGSSSASLATMQQAPTPADGVEYSFPALATAADGSLVLAFKDWGVFPQFWDGPPTDPAKIFVVRSADGGNTWSDPVQIAEGDFPLDFNFLEMTRLGSGRLLLNDLTPFEADHYYYSDDDGVTWTTAAIEELWDPRWHGPIDGKVWYTHNNPDTGALLYRTSSDGLTWSGDTQLMANVNPQRYGQFAAAVTSAGGSNVVAILFRIDWETGQQTLSSRRSTDGGATWLTPTPIGTNGLDLDPAGIERGPDGTLWLVAAGNEPWSGAFDDPFEGSPDIYYLTSDDGGQSWSDPVRFTSFRGNDYLPDVAFTADGPIIAFGSSRTAPGGIFYGLGGTSSDDTAPPAVINWGFPWEGMGAGETADVAVAAASTTAITGVDLVVTVNGDASTLALVEGGDACAENNLKAEICWTGTMGPFAIGSTVTVSASATDGDGLTGRSTTDRIAVLASHNVGAVSMPVQPNGFIGRIEWAGDNYGCCGGPWAGTALNGGTVVDEYGWVETDGFNVTAAPGESDMDIAVGYNDGGVLGLDVVQRSYQWSQGPASNGIVFEYEYTNNGSVGNITTMFAAMQLDADIVNGGWGDDLIGYSSSQEQDVIYMYDSGIECASEGSCPEGYIGLAVIGDASGSTGTTIAPHTATWNRYEKGLWQVMREGINPALSSGVSPDDHRMVLTAMPFPLPTGASQKIAFALVMGSSLEEMLANADAIASIYDSQVTGVEHDVTGELPGEFTLDQNYPNPFNPVTTFRFSIPSAAQASLSVYNLLGEQVATLLSGALPAGTHEVRWDAAGLASGTYLVRLSADGRPAQTRAIVLLK